MKFRPTEYNDLKEIIDASSIPYSSFSFVKKRGKLNVIKGALQFAFHRKTVVTIVAGNFVEAEQYTVWTDNDKVIVEHWAAVLTHFKNWIQSLS